MSFWGGFEKQAGNDHGRRLMYGLPTAATLAAKPEHAANVRAEATEHMNRSSSKGALIGGVSGAGLGLLAALLARSPEGIVPAMGLGAGAGAGAGSVAGHMIGQHGAKGTEIYNRHKKKDKK